MTHTHTHTRSQLGEREREGGRKGKYGIDNELKFGVFHLTPKHLRRRRLVASRCQVLLPASTLYVCQVGVGGGGGECSRTSLVLAVNKENLTNDGMISGCNRKRLEYSL